MQEKNSNLAEESTKLHKRIRELEDNGGQTEFSLPEQVTFVSSVGGCMPEQHLVS